MSEPVAYWVRAAREANRWVIAERRVAKGKGPRASTPHWNKLRWLKERRSVLMAEARRTAEVIRLIRSRSGAGELQVSRTPKASITPMRS